MPRIGFIAALPAESRSLLRRHVGFDGVAGLPGGHLLTVSGIGPENARRAAARLLDQGATALVSWGCAAALAPSLAPGDLVLPEWILGAEGSRFGTDAEWRGRLIAALAPASTVIAGPLAESREIASDRSAKEALHAATGGVAVDMESAAVARVAQAHGLPLLVVRAIADSASLCLPPAVALALTPRGDVRFAILLSRLLRHPGQIGDLIRLGRAFAAAMGSLRLVRNRADQDFCLPPRDGGSRFQSEP